MDNTSQIIAEIGKINLTDPQNGYFFDYADGFNTGLESALSWINNIVLIALVCLIIHILKPRIMQLANKIGGNAPYIIDILCEGCLMGAFAAVLFLYLMGYMGIGVSVGIG